jgi:phosphoserine aminotransferase
MLDWHGQGLSVMEMNTQNQHFLQIAKHVKADIKKLLLVPDDFSILFYPGDQILQFSAICYNLLGENSKDWVNCLETGTWSRQATEEAKKHCEVNVVTPDDWKVREDATIFHYVDSEQD